MYVEVKYGLLAVTLIGVGLLGMVMLISGAHLLMREVARSIRHSRTRRSNATMLQKRTQQQRLYARIRD